MGRHFLYTVLLLLLSLTARADELPNTLQPITATNAAQVEQLRMIGFGLIEEIAWSPDGEVVAVAGSLGITFYDSEAFDSVPYHRLTVPEELTRSVAYSPDGRLLATVSSRRLWNESDIVVFRLWDLSTEAIVAEWQVEYRAFDTPIRFSPDGTQLAIAHPWYDFGRSQSGTTSVWDITDTSNVQLLPSTTWSEIQKDWYAQQGSDFVPPDDVWLIAYSSNGRLVAYLGDKIYLLSATTGDSLFAFERDSYSLDDLYFTSDNRYLVSREVSEAGAGKIRVWDTKSGAEILNYDSGFLGAIAFHPTEPAILFSRWGEGIQYWHVGNETPHFVLGQFWSANLYFDVAFNPDGDNLAALHGRAIEFWDVASRTKQAEIYRATDDPYILIYYTEIAYNAAGTLLAAFDSESMLHLYNTETFEELASIQHQHGYDRESDVMFSPDGTLLATYGAIDSDIAPTAVFLWDVDTLLTEHEMEIGQELARIYFVNVQGIINQLVFSQDGETLAITGYGTEIWNVDDVLRWQVVGHSDDMHPTAMIDVSEYLGETAGPLAFSSNGELLATGSNGIPCRIAIWNLEASAIMTCITEGDVPVQSAIFSTENTLLITGAQPPFTRDTSGKSIHLWNVTTGESLAVLEGHFEQINRIVLSPDSTLIASAGGGITCDECPSFDGTIRLWGIPNEE